MMKVDLQITTNVDLEIEQAMLAEERQHVVKKRNSGLNGGRTRPINNDFDRNVGICYLALQGCSTAVAHEGTSIHKELDVQKREKQRKLSVGYALVWGCAGSSGGFCRCGQIKIIFYFTARRALRATLLREWPGCVQAL